MAAALAAPEAPTADQPEFTKLEMKVMFVCVCVCVCVCVRARARAHDVLALNARGVRSSCIGSRLTLGVLK